MGQKIAIVGAGFLGLTIALRCAQRGDEVTIYESAPEIGGLASAWNIGDVVWDKHYHVTLLSDSYTRKIVKEIGLAEKFKWVETKTGFFSDGKLYSMSNTLEFLRFPVLDLVSKIRLGATIFYVSRVKDWRSLEKIRVEDWLTRLAGKKTFDRIWRPLLKAKLGDAYKETSAAFIWATIQRMYAARKSGLKKEMFGYVSGGYAYVLRHFGEKLSDLGVLIHLSNRIERIEAVEQHRVSIATPTGPETFDKVVLTCPAGSVVKLVPDLSEDEKRAFLRIRYQGIICASVLMNEPLSDFYVTNITDETPFTGIIEMSALVDKSEFGGASLVYLPKYVEPNSHLFDLSDDEIREQFISGLEKMYPKFNRSGILDFKVSRVREVFPLPELDYSSRLPQVATSIPNLYVVNSAQITNGTLNVNETIALAEKAFGLL